MAETEIKNPETGRKVRVRIVNDDTCPSNPCENMDMLGTLVTWHRRYSIGHVPNPKCSPEEYMEENGISEETCLILPVYMYDHSGTVMSTKSFGCPWDSGWLGFLYVTNEKLKKEYGDLSKDSIEKATKCMETELKVMDQWGNGDVYGFIIEELDNNSDEDDDGNWDQVDSCWGFYGLDLDENGMLGYIDEEYHELAREAAENPEYRH